MKLSTLTGGASPLLTVRLWRDEPEAESEESVRREQLEAMQTFAQGWFEPLAVAVEVVCCDPEQGNSSYGVAPPPVPAWFMHISGVEGVWMEPTRVGSRVETCESFDHDAIGELVRRALDQRCRDTTTTGLESVRWTAVRVKVPLVGVTRLVIEDKSVPIVEIPTERRDGFDWVSGERTEAVTGPPFWFDLVDSELRFDVIWGLWLDGPGREQVDMAIERVLARGTGWYLAPD